MYDRYYYKRGSALELTNIENGCAECMSSASPEPATRVCPMYKEKRRQIRERSEDHEFYFCSSRDIKSTRLFWERATAMRESLNKATDAVADKADALRRQSQTQLHNLIKLNGQSIQCIYAVVPQDCFAQRNREDLLSVISNVVKERPEQVSKLLVDLLKNENLKKTEFSVYNKIFEADEPQIGEYSVHKVVLLVLNGYWDEFTKKNVAVRLGECYRKIAVDFDAFAAVLNHVMSNSVKYTLRGTNIQVDFFEVGDYLRISLDMISLRVNPEERERIFEEGYSGVAPQRMRKQGGGVGLSVTRKLLQSMGGEARMQADVDEAWRYTQHGYEFARNVFEIDVRLA